MPSKTCFRSCMTSCVGSQRRIAADAPGHTLPPTALRASRTLIRAGLQDAVTERLEQELEVFAARLASPEAREALTAFVEKRPPDFTQFD